MTIDQPSRPAPAPRGAAVARSGPLTWAQHIFWLYNHPAYFRKWLTVTEITRELRLPPGASAERLSAALAECAERFEALRTVYSRREDGTPQQMVLADHVPELVDGERDRERRFDICEAPSFRCSVRVEDGTVVEAAITANQIDLDGYAIESVRDMIESRLEGRAPDAAGPEPMQPLDLAEIESRPKTRRLSDRGIAAQRSVRARTPRNALPAVRPDRPRGRHRTRLADPFLLGRVERVAGACGASPASIFHAMIVLVLSAWSGQDAIAFNTATANRWRPGLAETVGRLASEADFAITVDPAETAAQWFKRFHGTLVRGYLHAARDFGACTMEALRDNVAAGSRLGKTLFIEYLQFSPDTRPGSVGPLVRRVVNEPEPGVFEQIRFDVFPMSPGVRVFLTTDTAILSPDEARVIVNLVANLLARCTDDPDLTVGRLMAEVEPPVPSAKDWILDDLGRFDADRIRDLLLDARDVTSAAIRSAPGDGIEAIVEGPADPTDVHEHMLRAVSGDPLTRMPTAYRFASGRFVPAEDYRPRIDDDPRTGDVAAVFDSCHPGAAFDPARSYAELHGDYLQIPAMVDRLERLGYVEVDPEHLLSLTSMAAFARTLERRSGGRP